MAFGNVLKRFTASPGFKKAYKNIGAANTKKGGAVFKDYIGGGMFGVVKHMAKRSLSKAKKKGSGIKGPMSKYIK